jgi:hypothetical protein
MEQMAHQLSLAFAGGRQYPKLNFSGQNGREKISLGCGLFGGKTSVKTPNLNCSKEL